MYEDVTKADDQPVVRDALGKLVDELPKGKRMEKILRSEGEPGPGALTPVANATHWFG